jgi:chromosome partitioning protein
MIVLFSHQKGGVGKSTSAINLAYECKNKIKYISILDLDSQHSAKLFNQLRTQNKLDCIDCYTQDDIKYDKLIALYKGNKDNLLIIDSGGYDSDINRMALVKADIIITPVGISQIEIFGLQKFRKVLKDASTALGKNIKTHILLNNVDSRSKKAIVSLQEYIKNNSQYFVPLNSILHTRTDYKSSYGNGLTVKEYNKKSKATDEVKALSKEIIKLILN